MELTWLVTAILLGVSTLLTVFFGWRGAQPPDMRRPGPRMIPWRFLMLMCAVVSILLLIHLLTVLGLKSDPPNPYGAFRPQ